jgi:predicted O-methyltransferase YrrM
VNIVDPRLDEYLERLVPERPPVVQEMEALAQRRHFPIVGPQVGRLLHLLARGIGAKHILECGSGFGYSAWWFATALAGGGRVVLSEGGEENCAQARDFLTRAGVWERIALHHGNALEVIERNPGPYDIVFCDIDKRDYPRVYPFLRSRLRPGGMFVCDNMLWFGRVAGPDEDPDTRGVRELTRLLHEDPAFVSTILPVRDGVSVSLKVS